MEESCIGLLSGLPKIQARLRLAWRLFWFAVGCSSRRSRSISWARHTRKWCWRMGGQVWEWTQKRLRYIGASAWKRRCGESVCIPWWVLHGNPSSIDKESHNSEHTLSARTGIIHTSFLALACLRQSLLQNLTGIMAWYIWFSGSNAFALIFGA